MAVESGTERYVVLRGKTECGVVITVEDGCEEIRVEVFKNGQTDFRFNVPAPEFYSAMKSLL